jgi:hypothetical protein
MRAMMVVASVLTLLTASARPDDMVAVSGSSVQYHAKITSSVADKKYEMKLTGAALRKKAFFNVYAVGSYVQSDFAGDSPEDLAKADTMKQLHLVMERDVDGKDMAKAFQEAVRNNYPNEFGDEIKKLTDIMQAHDVRKGDHVWITHIPGYGIHINLVGKKAEHIAGVNFGKAVWDIYLGPKNVGEAVKTGLVSRIK